MRIIISPCEKRWYDKLCAKCYPYWDTLVPMLKAAGHHLIQISELHHTRYDVHDFRLNPKGNNLKVYEIRKIIREECDTFITIDSFFMHLARFSGKRGIVIYSKSDPEIFGYPENINLLKHQKYLRKLQYELWKNEPYDTDAFVSPEEVIKALETIVL